MNTRAKQETVNEIKQGLFDRFQATDIKLRDISKEVLDLSPKVANEKASKYELPFPAHRLRPRGPWFVTIDDLALAIFSARHEAKQEWQSAQQTNTH